MGVLSCLPESWLGRDDVLLVLRSLGLDPPRLASRPPLRVSEFSDWDLEALGVPVGVLPQRQSHVQPAQHGLPVPRCAGS